MPEPLPLPAGVEGFLSPDGQSIAYQPITKWEQAWKRYDGGQTTPIWIVNLKTLDLVKVPRENSNDSNPVWVGNSVYFLSDRNGPVSLFRYDVSAKQVSQVSPTPASISKPCRPVPADLSTSSSAPSTWLIQQPAPTRQFRSDSRRTAQPGATHSDR